MGIVDFQEFKREGARLLIMLAGVSGGGKTFTALELAVGMAGGDPAKVGFLDTENGRGKLNARPKFKGLRYGQLTGPFSPARYIEAIQEFQRLKVEVLVIDSGTHEWEGIGGCGDIAEPENSRAPRWDIAKKEHKRFMTHMLSCNMHIVLCLRAREKSVPRKVRDGGKEKTVYEDIGLTAVCEKNVLFEATVSLMVKNQGNEQDVIKCPKDLEPILGRSKGYITSKDGEHLREWIAGGEAVNPDVEYHRNALLSKAELGLEVVESAWKETPKAIKQQLGKDFAERLKRSAQDFDNMRSASDEVESESATDTLAKLTAKQAKKDDAAAQHGEF